MSDCWGKKGVAEVFTVCEPPLMAADLTAGDCLPPKAPAWLSSDHRAVCSYLSHSLNCRANTAAASLCSELIP